MGEMMSDDFHSLHRVLLIEATESRVEAELIDNVHQFCVSIDHDGHRVRAIESRAVRFPWTSCPAGLGRLKALVDTPLRQETERGAPIDKAQQCTHLFDLAKLAIAHAFDAGRLRYDLRVDAEPGGDDAEAGINRDGIPILRWSVRGGLIVSDGPFQGHATTGRAMWPDAVADDAAMIEAAILLRRGLLVFFGRRRSKGTTHATQLPYMQGACLSFQPGVMEDAVRPAGFVDHDVERVAHIPPATPSPFER
jgi:hypothetical protein